MKSILQLLLLFIFIRQVSAQTFEITSPDERIKLTVAIEDAVTWSASLDDHVIIQNAVAAMDFSDGPDFGVSPTIQSDSVRRSSSYLYPSIPHKDAVINDEFAELRITFRENYELIFRAYDDGVAYQFVDNGRVGRRVNSEKISLTFPEGSRSLFPKEESLYSHYERIYLDRSLEDITTAEFCSLPMMVVTQRAKVLITETALHDYPGMFVRGNADLTLEALFPKYVLEAVDDPDSPDRSQVITKEADHIAEVTGTRSYPWRVFVISDDDRTFVESNLTYQLAKQKAIGDSKWIKPGKVAWDWYNANNIYGVDFKSGLNTSTYKYYIDFATSQNIEYVILDEGWTRSTTDILNFNPDIDVPELFRYAKEKGVGLILWVLWKPLDANLVKTLETYKSWGARGIKVDFMQRSDQYMVSSYERIARECARLELLVDFHGSFKPSGLRRAYPNVVNYEGVKGAENNKWSKDITPDHNVTIPFTRMVAGPMDYTPGAMSNRQEQNFAVSFERPMSLGTRAHQVAMYVLYEAPLQMLCASPSRYYEEQETVDFITRIPTTWDETVVLHGAIGDFIAVARRKEDTWHIGSMTDWTPRELSITLSFLSDGIYTMEIFKDGINADRFAEDYVLEKLEVSKNSRVVIEMAAGGGWAAIISKPVAD